MTATSGAAQGASRSLGDGHVPLRTQVREEIRRRILSHELPPGTKLVEVNLGEELGVSRNPVREALRALEGEGLVETLPRRGARVALIDERTVRELFEVREGLDGMAAALAARRVAAGKAGCEELREILARTERAVADGDVEETSRLNTEFHSGIVALTGNTLLHQMMVSLIGRIQWVFRSSVAERAPHSWHEHEDMYAAIAAGDEERARQLAIAHVAQAQAAALRVADQMN